LDLFSTVGPTIAERALEDALRKRLTSVGRLWSEYTAECKRGRNGCSAFRDAVLRHDDRDGTLQSRMEAKLRRVLKSLPGPAAVPQYPVGRYRLDFAYPDIRLGIEAQSIRWHLGRAKFAHDMKRDRDLKRQGWTLAYFTWDDVLRLDQVTEEVTALRASLSAVLF
jgi:very-short-patch-repair endonuclease